MSAWTIFAFIIPFIVLFVKLMFRDTKQDAINDEFRNAKQDAINDEWEEQYDYSSNLDWEDQQHIDDIIDEQLDDEGYSNE